MESNIKLLDCTLREAPINNLQFYDEYIKNYYQQLTNAGIDLIEVGFLKRCEHIEGSTIFSCVDQIVPYLPNDKKNARYFALVDYGRFSASALKRYDGTSIDGIRICFKKGEEKGAFELAEQVKRCGYLVSIQHVDTLDYSDKEIIDILEMVNALKPYAYSIVDTFGAMYADDVRHLYDLISNNLSKEIILGFHAHNNLALATANAQEFIRIAGASRNIIVDGSLMGCGRGAGNAQLEIMAEFLNKKYMYNYDFDILLDTIDEAMPYLNMHCKWGYSIPYFISGVYNAHVFNVNHLLRRHNIGSKDLRNIINGLSCVEKKRYDYTRLEELYIEYFRHDVNDTEVLNQLKKYVEQKQILLVAPGSSLKMEKDKIEKFIEEEKPIIIDVNNDISLFPCDFVFCSSPIRYKRLKKRENGIKRIVTSNVQVNPSKNEYIVNYTSLIKYGWINLDNSMILLLRLLLLLNVDEITISGFDGFSFKEKNFYGDMVSPLEKNDIDLLNNEIQEMFTGIVKEAEERGININFITKSQYIGGHHV